MLRAWICGTENSLSCCAENSSMVPAYLGNLRGQKLRQLGSRQMANRVEVSKGSRIDCLQLRCRKILQSIDEAGIGAERGDLRGRQRAERCSGKPANRRRTRVAKIQCLKLLRGKRIKLRDAEAPNLVGSECRELRGVTTPSCCVVRAPRLRCTNCAGDSAAISAGLNAATAALVKPESCSASTCEPDNALTSAAVSVDLASAKAGKFGHAHLRDLRWRHIFEWVIAILLQQRAKIGGCC